MKILNKKKITLILVVLTIFYILVSAFIIVNIEFLQAPEILIKVDFDEIDSDKALIKTEININNPNNFDIVTKNLQLISTTSDGYEIAHVFLDDRSIQSHSKKTFTENISVSFNGHNPGIIKSKVTGEVGANIFFIDKLIPINVGVVSSIKNLINNIASPNINVYAEIVDVSKDGIFINSTINAYNPNTFEIYIQNISAVIETEKGKEVGKIVIPAGNISAKDSLKLSSNGSILFEALNAETLIFKINGTAGGKFAGINKNIPFDVEVQIKVPKLEELFFSKEPTIFSIKVNRKITLKGPVNDIHLQINNTNKIDLVLKDVLCSIYIDVKEKSYFMGSCKINEDVISKAKEITNFSCSILTPWIKTFPILFDRQISDWFVVVVQAKVTISGVNQTVFVEVRGYEDQHMFR